MNESKKEATDAKKANEQRKLDELHEKRRRQLREASEALEALGKTLRDARSLDDRCDALLSHSEGFYEVVDKLTTRGKSLIQATDLIVEQANKIIGDAKTIVKNDIYLHRIKEFVPAGDNPVYPDVLISIRSVRDSLKRYSEKLESRIAGIRLQIRRANTVIAALTFFLDDAVGGDKSYPSEDQIEAYMDGKPDPSCLSKLSDDYERHFDLERLDAQGIQDYVSGDGDDEEDAKTEEKNQAENFDERESPTDHTEKQEADEKDEET
jgi:hypothetical protein